jgi:hypothetical protein
LERRALTKKGDGPELPQQHLRRKTKAVAATRIRTTKEDEVMAETSLLDNYVLRVHQTLQPETRMA